MKQGQALLQLQELELTIIDKRRQVRRINEQLSDNEAIRLAQASVDEAREILSPLQRDLKDLDFQITSAREKRTVTDKRLYSGAVTNPKELQDMQNEIAALGRRIEDLEEKILIAMVQAEEAQARFDEATIVLDETTAQHAGHYVDLVAEKKAIEDEIEALLDKRRTHLIHITPENLDRYNKLRPQKQNRPMSVMQEQSCSVCGVQQTVLIVKQVRTGNELIACTNCGRMLIAL